MGLNLTLFLVRKKKPKKMGLLTFMILKMRKAILLSEDKFPWKNRLEKKKSYFLIKTLLTPIIKFLVIKMYLSNIFQILNCLVTIITFILVPYYFIHLFGYSANLISLSSIRGLSVACWLVFNFWIIPDLLAYIIIQVRTRNKTQTSFHRQFRLLTISNTLRVFLFRVMLTLFVSLIVIEFGLHRVIASYNNLVRLEGALFTSMAVIIFSYIIRKLLKITEDLIDNANDKYFPEGQIIYTLFGFFMIMNSQIKSYLNEIQFRKSVAGQLDFFASRFESIMLDHLVYKNKSVDTLVDERLKKISGAIREMKLEILFSQNENYQEETRDKMRSFLVSFVTYKWDNLPVSSISIVRTISQRQKAINFLKIFLTGLFPFAIIFIVQFTYHPFSDEKKQYAFLICTLWFISSIIKFFDPGANEKISLLKEVGGIAGIKTY